jgi:hypothetical protein
MDKQPVTHNLAVQQVDEGGEGGSGEEANGHMDHAGDGVDEDSVVGTPNVGDAAKLGEIIAQKIQR